MNPFIVAMGITFPFDKVLYSLIAILVVDDAFNFIFNFSFDDVRCGKEMDWSMDIVLVIRGEERGMEYRVNVPLFQ